MSLDLKPGSFAIQNVSLMHVCTLPDFTTAIFSPGTRQHKSRTHNYVSPSAENGPAIAGPAGPVPAPMIFLRLISFFTCFVAWIWQVTVDITPWPGDERQKAYLVL